MFDEISENSLSVLDLRYYDKANGEKTADQLWDRCSFGDKEYRKMLSRRLFLPNSPTLFNLGTGNGGTLSACFVFDFADCLRDHPQSIMSTLDKAASVAKAGGGVGYFFGNLRKKGALVRSTHKSACGPVEVIRMCNRLASLITQGGKRHLAQMGVLNADHPDIKEFIHCKDEDPQGIGSFNLSVSWKNKMLDEIEWHKIDPVSGPWKDPNPTTALWWEQCTSAWQTGDPGMLFDDLINLWNACSHIGRVNATNPCGETPNQSDEPCNLGSIALIRFLKKIGKKFSIDWKMLKHYVKLATRYLDDVLDANTFPHPDIDKMSRHTRKLGLGVMGWADILALMHIPYDTDDAVELGRELMANINKWSLEESMALAKTKGVYPAYDKKKSPKWAPAARNSTRTSIAPTGTISIIADCSSGIEPHFALEWERTTNEGKKLQEKIHVHKELNGFVPKIANEIGIEWHVKHLAAFQQHTDLGVSKTINLPQNATIYDVSKAYKMMYDLKCKGGTIYRDNCRAEQVLVAKTKTKSVYMTGSGEVPAAVAHGKRKLSKKEDAVRKHKFKVGGVKVYLHVGLFDDGMPGEIFIRASKQGSTIAGLLDQWAMSVSNALQWGTPLEDLVRLHSGSAFAPSGFTGNPEIPNCTSIPDYIIRFLELRFLNKPVGEPRMKPVIDAIGDLKGSVLEKEMDRYIEGVSRHLTISTGKTFAIDSVLDSGELCPDCGNTLVRAEGCFVCRTPKCGYSKC